MRWGGFRSRRPTLFRPRRRWRLQGWLVAFAAVTVLVGVVLQAIDPAPAPREVPPAVPPVPRDRPVAALPPPRIDPAAPAGAAILTGRASVIDGDTLEIKGRRIRLHGIDAPESGQTCYRNGRAWDCGHAASQALKRFIDGRTVTCTELDVDRFGRSVARCTVGGEDINAWLVRNGWAVAYRRFSEVYVREEAEARAARRGIWDSRFEMRDGLSHPGR